MKKILIIILSIICLLFLVLFFYKIFKKTEQSEVNLMSEKNLGIETKKDIAYKKNLINFEEISREEYESKKIKYSSDPVYLEPETLPTKVERENNCLIFQDVNGKKTELELCDYVPKNTEPVEETQVEKYKNPIYIDTINAYLVKKNLYEGGRIYLLNAEYPNRLQEIFGVPIFSKDKKYFFLHSSVESAYQSDYGIEIWKVTNYGNRMGFSRLAYYSVDYFGHDVAEAFWVDDEIYLKTFWMNYDSYLKATINEFPTNLPRG